ncbi:YARHG domain-containing protein [Leptospira ellisii]|nr:YARHG domain-containing protein [Leptospira ellisii]MDV6236465.1 YARHG domain-containing protein [Leptospira ellisii]
MRIIRRSQRIATLLFAISCISFSLYSEIGNNRLEELILKRNELFARRGYKFKNGILYSHFREFDWYRPREKEVALSQEDKKRAEELLKSEKELSSRYADFLTDEIQWKEGEGEYFGTAEKTAIPQEHRRNPALLTETIPYRSEDFFTASIRPIGNGNDPKLFDSIRAAKKGELDSVRYFIRTYSKDGRYARLWQCYADSIQQELCDTKFVLEKDRLLAVSHAVAQTSYLQEWIYIYLDGKLYSGRFRMKSAGKIERNLDYHYE